MNEKKLTEPKIPVGHHWEYQHTHNGNYRTRGKEAEIIFEK